MYFEFIAITIQLSEHNYLRKRVDMGFENQER